MADQKILLPGRKADELALSFAGNIVKHLGVQMYAGRPVPAIAELISNAWDADATKVRVQLPLDEAWDQENQNHFIEVTDNGNGMTWEMVRDDYLDVGRDRRKVEKTDKSPGGRPLQGRKGVGKLAGFGIADVMEIQTVFKKPDSTVGQKTLIWFSLDLLELQKYIRKPAPVNLIYAGPVAKAPAGGRTKQGTTVTLRRLHQKRSLNSNRFHHSMAQRFLLIGPKFHVLINSKKLKEENIKLQWRWPAKKGWITDEVVGYGPVEYWIGFTHEPRKQNEGELSGILIYTRGKISQEATHFDISGGVTGQHGLRYLVGMVRAEWLDAGVDTPDLIATHRGSIAWESPQGAAFQDWGQKLLRKHLSEWAKLRTALREKQIREVHPTLRARIDRLAPSYKEVALQFVDKFKTVEMEVGEFEEILSWFLDALDNATLRSILQKLRDTDHTDLQELDHLLSRMEVRTAVTLLQIIEANLAAIETLEKMHRENAKERGVISRHLESNPWLIEPTWMLSRAEARVATWVREEFNLETTGDSGDDDRVDFFCVAVGGTLHIVEIKRGAHVATNKDIIQANKYRTYVTKRFENISDPRGIKYTTVQSHLIAAELNKDAKDLKQAYAEKGWVFFTDWDDLIERARIIHTQFRDILQKRAAESTEILESLTNPGVISTTPGGKSSQKLRTKKQEIRKPQKKSRGRNNARKKSRRR